MDPKDLVIIKCLNMFEMKSICIYACILVQFVSMLYEIKFWCSLYLYSMKSNSGVVCIYAVCNQILV